MVTHHSHTEEFAHNFLTQKNLQITLTNDIFMVTTWVTTLHSSSRFNTAEAPAKVCLSEPWSLWPSGSSVFLTNVLHESECLSTAAHDKETFNSSRGALKANEHSEGSLASHHALLYLFRSSVVYSSLSRAAHTCCSAKVSEISIHSLNSRPRCGFARSAIQGLSKTGFDKTYGVGTIITIITIACQHSRM